MLRIYLIVSIFISVIALPNNRLNSVRNGLEGNGASLFDTYQAIIDEGYPAETHHVTTEDGYILEVTRIPHGKNGTKNEGPRPVVFLMHGLLSAAHSFIFLGSKYSIGYHLADAGFDIWMGNARGNYYSRSHVTLDPDDDKDKYEFFDFSFEEIGMYDLAAMIDYALEKTGNDKLHYIGHSQGGTTFLVLTSMRPEYNEKIRAAHLLAGVGYQDYFPNTQIASVARLVDIIYGYALEKGLVEYFPLNITWDESSSRNAEYCFGDIKYKDLCYLAASRELTEDLDTENFQAGASLKQLAHYAQNIRDKKFRRWHYGIIRNTRMYGTLYPPLYDLKLISTFVTMYYSLSDILLDERDVLGMAKDIPNSKVHKVSRESFLHEDYVVSEDAKELVTDFIIEDIYKLETGNFKDWEKTEITDKASVETEPKSADTDDNENSLDTDDNGLDINIDDRHISGSASGATISLLVQVCLIISLIYT